MTDLINEKAMNYYVLMKLSQDKYNKSEKGKKARAEATKRYYDKQKELNPEFLKKMAEKANKRYHKCKEQQCNELNIIL